MKKSTKKTALYNTKWTQQGLKRNLTIQAPSEAIPGESYSIQALLAKQTINMPPLGKSVYDADNIEEAIHANVKHRNTKDITEMFDISQENEQKIALLKEEIDQKNADKIASQKPPKNDELNDETEKKKEAKSA